jgi:hypothetical protein
VRSPQTNPSFVGEQEEWLIQPHHLSSLIQSPIQVLTTPILALFSVRFTDKRLVDRPVRIEFAILIYT